MLTYNNDVNFKKKFVPIVAWHRKQDMVEKGSYGRLNGKWKGCAVACSLRSYDKMAGNDLRVEYADHSRFEAVGLWPEWLARLEDTLFENLPDKESLTWPERLARAVPVGIDLTPVKWKFSAFLLKENIDRVLSLDITDALKEQVVSAIRGVLTLHENAIQTGTWDESAAWSARSAAASARSAAWSAAASAAWSARSAAASARSAAWSAAASAAASARSAAWSAAASAESARSAAYVHYSKELLRLLRAEAK